MCFRLLADFNTEMVCEDVNIDGNTRSDGAPLQP